jgi:hypothetical protein
LPVQGKKTFNVDEETHHRAALRAREQRIKLEDLVRDAVNTYLKGEASALAPPPLDSPAHSGENPTQADGNQDAARLWAWFTSPLENEADRAFRLGAAAMCGSKRLLDFVESLERRYALSPGKGASPRRSHGRPAEAK